MRILLVTPYFYPHKGGSQQYAEELHYHLMQKYPDTQVDVICYNTDKSSPIEKYRGMTIYRIPCWQPLSGQFAIPNYITLTKTIKKLCKKHKYDAINSHTRFFESSWWVPFVAKYYKIPSILTDHCAHHPVHTSSVVNTVAQLVDQLLVPFISRHYSLVTVTNNATFSFLRKLGVQRPQIIYGGVDTRYYAPRKLPNPRSVPHVTRTFDEQDIIVSFVGRMIYSKGPHLLLEAAKALVKRHPQVTVFFAGDGNMYTKLSKRRVKNIIFLGSLERDEVAKLMANSDILVHPSLHHEGFPNVLLEAGASGCAVIATDKGGTKEIIHPDTTGILIEPTVRSLSNALNFLIEHPKKRQQLGKAVRKWVVNTYDWKTIVDTYHTHLTHLKIRS